MKDGLWAMACFALLGCSGSTTGTGLNGDGGTDQGGGGMFGMSAGSANKDAGAVETTATSTSTSTSCGAQTGNATCDACLNQRCCAEYTACKGNPDCVGLYRCVAQCSADDSSCIDTCISQYPNGRSDLSTAMTCIDKSCAKECQ